MYIYELCLYCTCKTSIESAQKQKVLPFFKNSSDPITGTLFLMICPKTDDIINCKSKANKDGLLVVCSHVEADTWQKYTVY